MPRKCCVEHCSQSEWDNDSLQNQILFHLFPRTVDMKSRWINQIKIENSQDHVNNGGVVAAFIRSIQFKYNRLHNQSLEEINLTNGGVPGVQVIENMLLCRSWDESKIKMDDIIRIVDESNATVKPIQIKTLSNQSLEENINVNGAVAGVQVIGNLLTRSSDDSVTITVDESTLVKYTILILINSLIAFVTSIILFVTACLKSRREPKKPHESP